MPKVIEFESIAKEFYHAHSGEEIESPEQRAADERSQLTCNQSIRYGKIHPSVYRSARRYERQNNRAVLG